MAKVTMAEVTAAINSGNINHKHLTFLFERVTYLEEIIMRIEDRTKNRILSDKHKPRCQDILHIDAMVKNALEIK